MYINLKVGTTVVVLCIYSEVIEKKKKYIIYYLSQNDLTQWIRV